MVTPMLRAFQWPPLSLLGKRSSNFLLLPIKSYIIWPLPTSQVFFFHWLNKYAKLFPPQGLWTCYSRCLDYSFPYFLMAGSYPLSMTSAGRSLLNSILSTAPFCSSHRTTTTCNYKFIYMHNSVFTTVRISFMREGTMSALFIKEYLIT